ncbi:pyridoxal-5'-phosphate-dependent protein [Sandarakinorhabdus cyanobacteriorum]|uniref:Pyridoxal-5'-phosphate-dependent protein n=1 Tax=Sandarakinorhabdus cyanobacteriorum TaxID=1981098 RepID=A0A255YK26_9SPHN|nr:threonine/serine dehydratase [Sandarakinorhabdus cyanobacteriorum]OYQ28830.1 pyridoxal-5'-phosphate-dependent protein [Sandarakinorhabdus cyanobacteriorum]
MTSPVTLADVEIAAARLGIWPVRTPLLNSPALDALCGGRIWLKPENLQHTGSFKFRGAMNRLLAIPAEARAGGVVAYSSGNHAQGVARAARLLGMPATIVMPSDAPKLKVERTRADGAEIVFYDRLTEARETIAAGIAEAKGALIVPPFADPLIIAGQGTAGLEAVTDLAARGETADLALTCCGGGGLSGGFAAGSQLPTVIVEPEGYDDVCRSLAAGRILPVENPGPTRCDALQTLRMAEITFATLTHHGATGVSVSEAEVARAVAFAFRELKLVVEPGGSVTLAALLAGKVDVKGKTVIAILSGGNIDPEVMAACLAEAGHA